MEGNDAGRMDQGCAGGLAFRRDSGGRGIGRARPGRAAAVWPRRALLVAAILAAGCLAAGCGQSGTVKNAIGSLSASSRPPAPSAATAPATPSGTGPGQPSSAPASPTSAPQPTPTTAAPSAQVTTAQPTVTAATASPAASGTSPGIWWLWAALAALVLIGLVTWIVRARGRRRSAAADWHAQVIDAYAKGAALQDAMSAAQSATARSGADADVRWSDIQRRADDLSQTLYAMREAAPGEAARATVLDVLASLQAARSAMDAERVPGGAGDGQAEVVRQRLAAFETSLRALRAPSDRSP